ncbi:MAG: long-chain fatty acid--CoA ligase [Melioribacteraceae bacterium]|nr:long-chain fatty acid--CoA ligase [Melioribacteraceae bacterium]
MPSLKDFKTIPEMYDFVTKKYGNDKTYLRNKVSGKFIDISFQEVRDTTEKLAMGLAALGVLEKDKVAIIAENRPEWYYADFAILGLGAVDVPLYPISTADSIEYMINNSEAVGVIVSTKFQLNKVLKIRSKCKGLKFIINMGNEDTEGEKGEYTFDEVLEKGANFKNDKPTYFEDRIGLAQEDDLCTIIYTSGTTGEPKGVLLTHKNIISNVKAALEVVHVDHTDSFLSFLPLSHIFERMAGFYLPLSCGATVAFAESIEKISSNMGEIKPTVMTGVPRLFERIYSKIQRKVDQSPEKKQKIFNWAINVGQDFAERKRNGESVPIALGVKRKLADKLVFAKLREATGSNLRFFISGGAALARELGVFLEAVGILVLEGYGLTESSPVIAVNRPNDYKFGSVGKPIPGVEVKIAKDGEILAYGPNIMPGYFKKKKETAEMIDKDGWLHTGDIGVFDAEGFLLITDRKKSLFKNSGGKYIAPTPIENLFLGSKYIDQFIIIGDKRMFITALIVPDFESLREYADANRIPYTSDEDLVSLKQIDDMMQKDFAQFQKQLAKYEKVRKFTLLSKPFTIEGGEMTPSLKLKRKVIEARYEDLIDDMYKGMKS